MYIDASDQILGKLRQGPKSIPDLVHGTGLDSEGIRLELLSLEQIGMVRQCTYEVRRDVFGEVTRWQLVSGGLDDSFSTSAPVPEGILVE